MILVDSCCQGANASKIGNIERWVSDLGVRRCVEPHVKPLSRGGVQDESALGSRDEALYNSFPNTAVLQSLTYE